VASIDQNTTPAVFTRWVNFLDLRAICSDVGNPPLVKPFGTAAAAAHLPQLGEGW
jgi:hypothetical protein